MEEEQEKQQKGVETVPITRSEMRKKFKTKVDLYEFLVMQCKLYMIPYNAFTYEFGRQILSGEKLALTVEEVYPVFKPIQDQEIKTSYLLEIALKHQEISKYIPKLPKNTNPDRIWICTIINSIIPDFISKMIFDMKKFKFKEKEKDSKEIVLIQKKFSD